MNSNQLFKSTLACAVTLGMASAASVAMAQSMPMSSSHMQMAPTMEKTQQRGTMKMMKEDHFIKSYGINAAHKNDCKSPGHSYAGQDSKARDPTTYAVLSGL